MKRNRSRIAIVCPIYKSELSPSELFSFNRTVEILSNFDFYFVGPHSLDLSKNQNIKIDNYKYVAFDDSFFKSTKSYNKLLMDKCFYAQWLGYTYILICQLDCYIFHDDFSLWIEKEYDFVGAPWFKNYTEADINDEIIGVGNGGFSLRNVKASYEIVSDFKWKKVLLNFNIFGLPKSFYKYLKHNIIRWNLNEDLFWCTIVPYIYKDFKVASVEDAISFSFESNPQKLYKMNNYELPLGCHAFERYSLEFWAEHIPELRLLIQNK